MKLPRQTDGAAAFTLVEMLVVIAIIALLAALTVPALAAARRQGQRSGCLGNMRQIVIATRLFADNAESYPPAWIDSQTRWMDRIKPFLDKKSVVYLCPSDTRKIAVAWDPTIFLSYGMNTFNFGGQDACFWYGVKVTRVARPSETIIFADCTPGKYYCGGGRRFAEPVVDVDYRHLSGSFVAAFCDDHVEVKTTTKQTDWDASQ
jgi:prepilin-type N-terminal cleavage/methylation domain-containing protein